MTVKVGTVHYVVSVFDNFINSSMNNDWVSGNEEMMKNDDNLDSTSTLLN